MKTKTFNYTNMNKLFLSLVVFLTSGNIIAQSSQSSKMEWWKDAKFGMFLFSSLRHPKASQRDENVTDGIRICPNFHLGDSQGVELRFAPRLILE